MRSLINVVINNLKLNLPKIVEFSAEFSVISRDNDEK